MNILITSASRKVSLVQAFQQALVSEGGGKVVAADISPRAAALYVADEHIIVPRIDDPEFLDSILAHCKSLNISLIIPTRDEELPLFAHAKDLFADQGIHVMVSSEVVVELCQDKIRFAKFCEEEGFGVPTRFECMADISSRDMPVFVRTVHGKGSAGAWRADSISELNSILKVGEDVLIQECIDAPEFTVDLFSDFTARIISVVVREREYVFGGESFIGRTVKHQAIIDETIRIAERLALIGHNTLQCFQCEDGIKWIEINPRYGGGASLGFEAGARSPLYLVKIVGGEKVGSAIGEYAEGVTMLRYTQDIFLRDDQLARA